jgi:hypothetical protein
MNDGHTMSKKSAIADPNQPVRNAADQKAGADDLHVHRDVTRDIWLEMEMEM